MYIQLIYTYVYQCDVISHTLLLRLVDCSSLLERSEVYEMIDYDRVIKRDLEKSKNLLNKKYTRMYIHTYTCMHTVTHIHNMQRRICWIVASYNIHAKSCKGMAHIAYHRVL